MADIDGYNNLIRKSDVENRIEELEDSRRYNVMRTRNDEVLETFDDEAEAESFIEDEDYNPERVVVRRADLDGEDARELANLRQLIGDVGSDSDWTLYSEDYFDADWARDQARDKLGPVDFDAWPLDQIDWSEAAGYWRDSLCPYEYTFDGATFYRED